MDARSFDPLQVSSLPADTARMDMKAMMFAGGGLALSMIVTTIWISGDVTRMREETAAKRAAECAAKAQARADSGDASSGTPQMTVIDPTTGQPVAEQPAQQEDPCAGLDGAAGTTDVTAGQEIDPNTGLPLDPGAGNQQIDPATGVPADPAAGSEFTDPNAGTGYDSGYGYDDAPGGTTYDPQTDAGYGATAPDPNAAAGIDPVTGQPLVGDGAVAGY